MLSILKPIIPFTLLLAATVAIGACEDTADPEPEPDIASLRLTVATSTPQTINVTRTPGCGTSASIALPLNTTVPVTASFRNSAGDPDPIANDPAVFRLSGGNNPSGAEPVATPTTITWVRTGPFAGTLRGTATTSSGSIQFSAFHIEDGHEDFGPCTVGIVVTP